MSLFSRPLRATCSVALLLPAFLAGCSGDTQPTKFAPLRYDYLSVIHLNTGTLDIVDNTQQNPVAGDIGAQAPTPPVQALRQMAEDRLVAAGSSGTAKFVIDRASILHNPGGELAGQMDVHLSVLNSNGTQTARATAHVSETMRPDLSKGDADSPANLYEITNDMMQRMNVEFEFQVRKTMKDWIVDAGGTPVGSAIQSQSLDAPGAKGRAAANGATAAAVSSAPALTPPAVTPLDVTTPTVSVPDVAPSATMPENAPNADTAPASTTPKQTAPAKSSEPDPVFPAGEDDGTSTPATPKARSPAPGVLKLPQR